MDEPGFFARLDPSPDAGFYGPPRLVTHIDDGAIAAVGGLYSELGLDGAVLDLMSSWISHFQSPPRELTVLGMNAAELEANAAATRRVVRDLNADPELPFGDGEFEGAVCCVSVDYLVRPLEVFAEVARVLRPGAPFCVTFSNRCFPSKAVRGWLVASEDERVAYVRELFRRTPGFGAAKDRQCPTPGDPLWGVWAFRAP